MNLIKKILGYNKEINEIQALQNAINKLNKSTKNNKGTYLTPQETKIIQMNMFLLLRTP